MHEAIRIESLPVLRPAAERVVIEKQYESLRWGTYVEGRRFADTHDAIQYAAVVAERERRQVEVVHTEPRGWALLGTVEFRPDLAEEDDQPEDLEELHECPACNAVQAPEESALGVFGSRIHHRCRACGWQWSQHAV